MVVGMQGVCQTHCAKHWPHVNIFGQNNGVVHCSCGVVIVVVLK